MPKITMPDGERWMTLRDHGRRFKAGERRALYERFDAIEGGDATKSYTLMRLIAAMIIDDWSLDFPRPRATWKDGTVTFENLDSLDELDTDMEDELFDEVRTVWYKRMALSVKPSKDPASPTVPSGG